MCKLAWLIAVSPDIHKANRRMKTIEHDERQRQMIQNRPGTIAIEVVAFIFDGRILHGKCVEDPQADISNGEKCDEFTTWRFYSRLFSVGAATQCITNPRCLNQHLDDLRGNDENVQHRSVEGSWNEAEDCLGEEGRNGDEKQEIIEFAVWRNYL